MWATSVPILVFLDFSFLDLGPMYVTEFRQTDRRETASSLYAPPIRGGGITIVLTTTVRLLRPDLADNSNVIVNYDFLIHVR